MDCFVAPLLAKTAVWFTPTCAISNSLCDLGLMVRDARRCALLTMRVEATGCLMNLILRGAKRRLEG
jgi:hypothetical protein